MRKTRYRIIEKTLTIIMAMALILTNIQIGAFAVINEVKNQTTVEQSIGEGSTAARQEKPKIEILNDSGRSIKADSENFNFTNDTSLKVKIDTKKKPTVLTLKLPYYYKFADNISEDENYTVLSVDDAIPADMGTDSEIMRNLIKIEVPAAKDGKEKQLSIILPIQLNKEALLKSIKKDKESKNKQTSGTKNTDNVSKKEDSSKKQTSESKNTENVSNKESSKNIEVISPKTKDVESITSKKSDGTQNESISKNTENITSKKSDSSQSESISKNIESVSEKTDSKSSETVKREETSPTSTENISTKFSKKSVKTEDMSKVNNIADNPSETSFILTAEQSQVFVESGEDSTVTIPWINPNSIKIDENDLKKDSNTEETDLSQVAGSLEKDLTEISTDIKHLTGLVDNKDVADLVEENINDTNDTQLDTTSKETVSSGSHSSKDKTGSKIDSTSDTESDKNTESDKKSDLDKNTESDKKSEEDKNKEPDKKTDKTEEQNNKKEDGKEEQGKTAEENKDSTNTNVVTNPIDDNVLGKAEEPGKENEIPILKPENQPPVQIEPEAEKMLDKLDETGINPLQPKMMAAESSPTKSEHHPATLELKVKDSNNNPVDFDNLVLGKLENGKAHIDVTAELNRPNATRLLLTLPDYYSFDPAIETTSSTQYDFVKFITDTSKNPNAVRNQILVEVKLGSPSNPGNYGFDLPFGLNRESISKTDLKNWEEGTWNPNKGNCNFSVAADNWDRTTVTNPDDTKNVKIKHANIKIEDYKGIWVAAIAKRVPGIEEVKNYTSEKIYEHGNTKYTTPIRLAIYYEKPDPFIFGPVDYEKVDVHAPEGFYFIGYRNRNGDVGDFRNMSENSSCEMTKVNGKNKIATIKWKDDGQVIDKNRLVGDLGIVPDDHYWTTNNKNKDNMLPSGSSYGFDNEVHLKVGGKDKTIKRTFNYDVEEYILADVNSIETQGKTSDIEAEVKLNNQKVSIKGRQILQQTDPGDRMTISKLKDGSNDENYRYPDAVRYQNSPLDSGNYFETPGDKNSLKHYPRRIPETDGKGTVLTATFPDKRLKIDQFSIGQLKIGNPYVEGIPSWDENLSETKVEKIVYYTDDNKVGTLEIDPNNYESITFDADKLCKGTRLSKVEIHYSKLGYIGSAIGNLTYTTDKKTEYETILPINYDYKYIDKNGNTKTLPRKTNYILVTGERCPEWQTWGIDAKGSGMDSLNGARMFGDKEFGSYGDGKEYIYNPEGAKGTPEYDTKGLYGFYLKTKEIGNIKNPDNPEEEKRTGYITELENPIFSTKPPDGKTTLGALGYFTNGKIYMNPAIKDGWKNWKVELVTCTAKDYKNGLNIKSADAKSPYTKTYSNEYREDKNPDLHTWDLYKDGTIKDKRQMIIGARFIYKGILDISPLSDEWNGKKTRKDLFRFGIDELPRDPLSGMYFADQNLPIGYFGANNLKADVYYKGCKEITKDHEREVDGVKVGKDVEYGWSRIGSCWKGSETLIPEEVKTEIKGFLKQNATTTLTANISLKAQRLGDGKLFSGLGETFYFKLADQKYSTMHLDSAKIDGKPVKAEKVEINGKTYVKITNVNDGPVEKKPVNIDGSMYTFEPWKVSMEFFTIPTAPGEYPLVEDGNWIDLKGVQKVEKDNERYVIQSSRSAWGVHYGNYKEFVDRNDWLKDNPLNLYKDKEQKDYLDYPEHHWALSFKGFKNSPNVDQVQYMELSPGVNEVYESGQKSVMANQEYDLTTGISVIAPDGQDMKEFKGFIELPRKGDYVKLPAEAKINPGEEDESFKNQRDKLINTGTSTIELYSNRAKKDEKYKIYTTNVDLYLKGPLHAVQKLGYKDSHEMKFSYSKSPRGTKKDEIVYVDEKDTKNWTEDDWKDVNFIKLDDDLIKANDKCFYVMPLRTGATLEGGKDYKAGTADGGGLYAAFVKATYETKELDSKDNLRLNAYLFEPFELSGKIWDDKNGNGMKDKYKEKGGTEVDEPGIDLTKKVSDDTNSEYAIDLQISRDGSVVDNIDKNKDYKKFDVPIVPDENNPNPDGKGTVSVSDEINSKYTKKSIRNTDGTYKFYTSQFKDITYQLINKVNTYYTTKCDEDTQNIFEAGVRGPNTANAQKIIPPNGTILDNTSERLEGKVSALDGGLRDIPPLPKTGGIGETIFYVAGLLVVGMSFISTKVLLKL